MNKRGEEKNMAHAVSALAVAAGPLAVVVVQILFGSAPWSTLWIGLGLSVVAFMLLRFLSGYAPLGRRRLAFGRARRLRVWQAPVLWVPAAVAAGMFVFWLFAA